MIDDKGRRIKKATPSMPVEILGLNSVPNAGEIFQVTAREGLSNALRHGHPDALQFTLKCTDDAATLTVEDFSTSLQRSIPAESKDEGYGLRSLRERAEQVGGTLHAEPTTEGFFLGVSLPLTESV